MTRRVLSRPEAQAAPKAPRLTARSVIVSTLLGVSPPELPTRSLVATAELLGVAPGTTRVAISRLVARDELEATTDAYRLVGAPLLARQSRQVLSRRGAIRDWDGSWRTAIVNADRRPPAERAELRHAMAALRYGELREGVWLRPDNLPTGVLPEAETLLADRCTLLRSRPDDPVDLAERLWDLGAWSGRARAMQRELDRLGGRLERRHHEALAEGFVTSADVLRHLQADPLLPAELLPPDWPGPRLRTTYAAYDDAFKANLADWLRTHRASSSNRSEPATPRPRSTTDPEPDGPSVQPF